MNFDVLADDLGVHRTTSLWRRTLYCVLTPVSVQVVIPAEARSFSRADEGSLFDCNLAQQRPCAQCSSSGHGFSRAEKMLFVPLPLARPSRASLPAHDRAASAHLKLNLNFPPGRKTKPKIQKLAGG
jgi:hypothetical protein